MFSNMLLLSSKTEYEYMMAATINLPVIPGFLSIFSFENVIYSEVQNGKNS